MPTSKANVLILPSISAKNLSVNNSSVPGICNSTQCGKSIESHLLSVCT